MSVDIFSFVIVHFAIFYSLHYVKTSAFPLKEGIAFVNKNSII